MEFVDEIVDEEGAGDFAAAHQPDVFAFSLAQAGDDLLGRVRREDEAIAIAGGQCAGHDVVLDLAAVESAAHYLGDVVGLAAEDGGVNGLEERGHRVVLGHEEEVDRTVGTRDVAVEADTEAQHYRAAGASGRGKLPGGRLGHAGGIGRNGARVKDAGTFKGVGPYMEASAHPAAWRPAHPVSAPAGPRNEDRRYEGLQPE